MAIKNLNTGNGIAKKLLQRLHITAVPRDLDRVADGTLYAARRRGKLLRDLRIEHLRHGVDGVHVVDREDDRLAQILIPLNMRRNADLVDDVGNDALE